MLLKKIINLHTRSYKQLTNISKPVEDFVSECSENSIHGTIEEISDGVHSCSSSTKGTNIQRSRSTPLNSLVDKASNVPVPAEISDREFQERSPFETMNEVECVPEVEAETPDCCSRGEYVPSHDLSVPSNEKSDFYRNTTADSNCHRDMFAQTEGEVRLFNTDSLKDSFAQTEAQVLDEHCQWPVITSKHAANENIIAPSDSNRHTNRFTQTKSQIPPASKCRYSQTVTQVTDQQKQLSVVTKHAANNSTMDTNRKYKSCVSFNAKSISSNLFPNVEKQNPFLDPVIYGTLFVFGCNGSVPPHLVGKMSSKYVLRKRVRGNGVKEAFCYIRPSREPVCVSPAKHVISYPASSSTCIDVAFKSDPAKDMFQIGRHSELPIDFTVDDLKPSDKSRRGVSRYACRILVRRDGNHEARIYAAAFDSSQTIFLGEEGIPCAHRGKTDGFTTNGVLIMKPRGNQPGSWREVSVSGNIYPVRHFSKMETSKRPRIIEESNILQDGTLIDLCGLTLLWRTPDGLNDVPNEEDLLRLQSKWHRSVPESLLLSQALTMKSVAKKAYVFLSCGHVVGLILPKGPHNLQGWSCPVCRVINPIAELKIGAVPGFHLNKDFPTFAFNPCGHVASQRTVEYWSCVKIPLHRSVEDSVCPFCGMKLSTIKKYVKLYFPSTKKF